MTVRHNWFRLRACSIVAFSAWAPGARAQRPLNLGFERASTQGTGRPWGWSPLYGAGDAYIDSAAVRAGRYSVRVHRAAAAGEAWGAIRLFIPPLAAQRKTLVLTAWVQSNGTARARVSLESWAIGRVVAGDSATVATQGPTTWVKQTLRVRVDTGAFAAVITLGSQGTGDVWYDDLRLEIDGRRFDAVPVSHPPAASDVNWLNARQYDAPHR